MLSRSFFEEFNSPRSSHIFPLRLQLDSATIESHTACVTQASPNQLPLILRGLALLRIIQWLTPSVYSSITRPQHYWQFGPCDAFLGAVLCIVVLSVALLASTHQMLIALLVMLLEISPGSATCPCGGNYPPLKTTGKGKVEEGIDTKSLKKTEKGLRAFIS